MNATTDRIAAGCPIDDRSLDRLVDGELSDADRRSLLLQLDSQPDGWRRLAIAFLESQTFREALQPLAAPRVASIEAVAVRSSAAVPVRFRVRRYAALAASLLATFGLGWFLNGNPSGGSPGTPVAALETPPLSPRLEPESGESVAMLEEASPEAEGTADVLSELVKRAEQSGYTTEWQKSKISLELRDGRKVEVPVREVRLQYAGGRTY